MVYIEDAEVHRQRFVKRQQKAPRRSAQKYLDNFREIRWIHDYLVGKAQESTNITLIENGGTSQEGLEKILRNFCVIIAVNKAFHITDFDNWHIYLTVNAFCPKFFLYNFFLLNKHLVCKRDPF